MAERLLNTLCKHTVKPSVLPTEGDRRKPENLSGACERLANLLLWRVEADIGQGVLENRKDEGHL